MIENENKRRANLGEFLQGGEPPLIGRARSSQKTSFLFVFTFPNLSCIFLKAYPMYIFFNLHAIFLSHTSFYVYFSSINYYFFLLSHTPVYAIQSITFQVQ
jgi:hypothetical protein